MNLKLDGEKLRAVRRKAGLTQVELAQRIKVTQAFISRIEKGDRGGRPRTVEKLAHALSVKPEDLLNGPPPAGLTLRGS